MIKKSFLLISCLLILLVAIGTSAANEVNDDFNLISEDNSESIILTSDSSDNLNSWDNLKSIIENASENDTIYLNGSTYSATNESIEVTTDITINGGFSNGTNAVATIDGNSLFNLINNTAKLTIINVNFINFHVNSSFAVSGMAIYSSGENLTLINCSFINNFVSFFTSSTSSSVYGGILYIDSGELNIVNCSFINNTFLSNNSGFCGAMICIEYGDLIIANSTFINNFIRSPYSIDGGIIRIDSGNSTVYNCNFINNTVYSLNYLYGGCVYLLFGNLTIVNCSFTNNTISNASSTVVGGGIVYLNTGSLTLLNSSFIDNSAFLGEIYGMVATAGNSLIDNSIFKDNIVPHVGYIIHSFSKHILISNSSFINNINSSLKQIFVENGNVSFNSNSFSNCDVPITLSSNVFVLSKTFIVGDDIIGGVNSQIPVNIKFTDDGNNYIVFIENKATIVINNTKVNLKQSNDSYVGVYSSNVAGVKNISFNQFTNLTSKVKVLITSSTISLDNLTKMYKNDSQLFATILDNEGKPVEGIEASFNINGVTYKRVSDANGNIKLTINLRPGVYMVTVNNQLTGQNKTAFVTVLSTIISSNLTKYFKNNSQYYATILDAQGNPVGAGVKAVFNIHGVFYEKITDSNGTIKLDINLSPGVYIITIMNGDLNQTNTVIVLPIIDSENIEMTTSNRKPFNVIVLDGKGVPTSGINVKFNINGVFYNKTTDSNGVASLNITLIEGSYIITSILDNGYMQSNTILVVKD